MKSSIIFFTLVLFYISDIFFIFHFFLNFSFSVAVPFLYYFISFVNCLSISVALLIRILCRMRTRKREKSQSCCHHRVLPWKVSLWWCIVLIVCLLRFVCLGISMQTRRFHWFSEFDAGQPLSVPSVVTLYFWIVNEGIIVEHLTVYRVWFSLFSFLTSNWLYRSLIWQIGNVILRLLFVILSSVYFLVVEFPFGPINFNLMIDWTY